MLKRAYKNDSGTAGNDGGDIASRTLYAVTRESCAELLDNDLNDVTALFQEEDRLKASDDILNAQDMHPSLMYPFSLESTELSAEEFASTPGLLFAWKNNEDLFEKLLDEYRGQFAGISDVLEPTGELLGKAVRVVGFECTQPGIECFVANTLTGSANCYRHFFSIRDHDMTAEDALSGERQWVYKLNPSNAQNEALVARVRSNDNAPSEILGEEEYDDVLFLDQDLARAAYSCNVGSLAVGLRPVTLRKDIVQQENSHILVPSDLFMASHLLQIAKQFGVPTNLDYLPEHDPDSASLDPSDVYLLAPAGLVGRATEQLMEHQNRVPKLRFEDVHTMLFPTDETRNHLRRLDPSTNLRFKLDLEVDLVVFMRLQKSSKSHASGTPKLERVNYHLPDFLKVLAAQASE